MTGATKLTPIQLLYEETGWETLQSRRDKHKLIKFHEMYHKVSTEYLSFLIPPQISETHQCKTIGECNNNQKLNFTAYEAPLFDFLLSKFISYGICEFFE